MSIVYLDGRFIPADRAKVPAVDPALGWGLGVFEVLRGYKGRPFRPEHHQRRLERSAAHFGIETEIPSFGSMIEKLLARNRLRSAYVRVTLTADGHLLAAAREPDLPSPRVYREGARLLIAPWRRDPRSPLAGHKTLNYLELMLAREAAKKEGAVDALLLGLRGEVLEGSRSNLFAVRRGRLITPPVRKGILPGVTRQVVNELAAREGIDVVERVLRRAWLPRADELFVTSTIMEIVPIAQLAGRALGPPGPITRRLQRAFRECVRRETAPAER